MLFQWMVLWQGFKKNKKPKPTIILIRDKILECYYKVTRKNFITGQAFNDF